VSLHLGHVRHLGKEEETVALDQFEVVTLFVPDIAAAKEFYVRVFEVPVVYEDEVSAVFGFAGTMVNLLARSEAPDLVAPRQIGFEGTSVLLTIEVDDVDAECARLGQMGVFLLNGPVDRPWGRRTAAFADPAGHVWELAQVIS
jgi:catechol 2,3-dioxygenase-like lactoylglutathione lyase family enzyme